MYNFSHNSGIWNYHYCPLWKTEKILPHATQTLEGGGGGDLTHINDIHWHCKLYIISRHTCNTRFASASGSLFSKRSRLVVTPHSPLRWNVDNKSGRISLSGTVTAGHSWTMYPKMCQLRLLGRRRSYLEVNFCDNLSSFLRFATQNIRLFQIAAKIHLKLYA